MRRQALSDLRPWIVGGCALLAACTGRPDRPLTVQLTQPWTEHEARFDVALDAAATVAVACRLGDDPGEIHLVEGTTPATAHQLRMPGLLAASTYRCSVAAVDPPLPDGPIVFEFRTGLESEPLLPDIHLISSDPRASHDYIVTNHQNSGTWNGQRRLVIDPDARVRWHSTSLGGADGGGSAIGYFPGDATFTVGGGWPPSNTGRPLQIDLYGAEVRFDTRPLIPFGNRLGYHHEARRLADGRFLALSERRIEEPDGSRHDGFGFHIVNPETEEVDFTWTSQAAYDAGLLDPGDRDDDPFHPNWADVADDAILVSLCNTRMIVAIDIPSGDLRWRFGAGVGDWTLVDADGQPLPDSEFPQCQHGSMLVGDELIVYDNGHLRDYSRVVDFALDEETMVATKLWEWTEPDWHESSLGGVAPTSGGGVLVSMSHIEDNTFTPGDHTTFVELDPASGDKLWEAQYGWIGDMAFRAQAVGSCDIFANAAYCDATRERVDELRPVLGLAADRRSDDG